MNVNQATNTADPVLVKIKRSRLRRVRRDGGRGVAPGQETALGQGKATPPSTGSTRFQRTARERQELLDAALSDNSREIQARFRSTHGATAGPLSDRGQLAAMVRNLSSMVSNQIRQYTGDEPYRRADYRLFLDTFAAMQGPTQAPADPWQGAARGTFLDRLMDKASGVMGILEPTPSLGLDTVG